MGVAGFALNTFLDLKRAAPQIDVDYITRLGRYGFSKRIKSFIVDQLLGTSAIKTDEVRVPNLYAITNDLLGERSFSYWKYQSAAQRLLQ